MSFMTLDNGKCSKDGLCVKDCPMEVLRLSRETGFPELRAGAAGSCIRCGHCVAICPTRALSLAGAPLADCLPVDAAALPGSEQIGQLLRSRRAVRQYQSTPVSREMLEQIIDTSRWAPSAKNFNPLQWLVIDSPDGMEQLKWLVIDWMKQMIENSDDQRLEKMFRPIISGAKIGTDYVFWSAPALLVVHARCKIKTAPTDASIALTGCELMAQSLGLGSCWAGYFQMAADTYQPLQKALGLSEDDVVLGAVMVGHPAVVYQRIPPRPPARVRWLTA